MPDLLVRRYTARTAPMELCPCGHLGHPRKPCRCSPGEVQRYTSKLSGPILDRIDVRVEVGVPPADQVGKAGETGETASARQVERYASQEGVHCKAQIGSGARRALRARPEATALLRRALSHWDLSVRAYEHTLALSRSIADLDGASDIDAH